MDFVSAARISLSVASRFSYAVRKASANSFPDWKRSSGFFASAFRVGASKDAGSVRSSDDGGRRWTHLMNLPVSQFYHVSVDNAEPYHVYGGLQDNSSWMGDSS